MMDDLLRQAITAFEAGNFNACELALEEVLKAEPKHLSALQIYGLVKASQGQHQAAVSFLQQAVQIDPQDAGLQFNLAKALSESDQEQAALAHHELATQLTPFNAAAWLNFGISLFKLGIYEEALSCYQKALAIQDSNAAAWFNQGLALKALGRNEAALNAYGRAIQIKPDYFEAWLNTAILFTQLHYEDKALIAYEKALAIKPNYDYLFAMPFNLKMTMGNWIGYEVALAAILSKASVGEKAITPFGMLAISSSPELQLAVAKQYTQNRTKADLALPAILNRQRSQKIRLAYYSADFRNHAVTQLLAGLFENHNKAQFEVIAFSFGHDNNAEVFQRINQSLDQLVDIQGMSDLEVAKLSREMEIDIAVDLMGLVQDSRPGLLAYRAAPIQVNYLGYPGTMGADYIDYIIADHTLIPADCRQYYAEKIAYLPFSYQANDNKKQIAEKTASRTELGLPEQGFVFCCFNNNYKITPPTFDSWMRILGQVEGSVLWLLEDNRFIAQNLRLEAIKRNIKPERLIFAPRLSLAEHLARHRAADLFLDTLPYNAHTTASDALWAGLPVLTCMDASFASRVAASLLNAIGLPELITTNSQEYESLAIALANDSARLQQLRTKLAAQRLTAPLFNTPLFAQQIETAYIQMMARYWDDLPIDHILFQSPAKIVE
jgi:predicted O-linked N-acetylglucosamine transferase (SPINDLY family)